MLIGRQIEGEGKTLREAIESACELLGISQRDLEYKLNTEHFRGGADTVKIVAWKRDGRDFEIGDRAREFLTGILDRIGLSAQVDIETSDDCIRAILVTDDATLIIGRGGQTLDSIQHLVNKSLVRNKTDKKIVIDLENFRERREYSLKQVAQRVCEKVLAEGRSITLKPMNAYDRRLIHLEVSRHRELESRSFGDGQMKRVQVYKVSIGSSEMS